MEKKVVLPVTSVTKIKILLNYFSQKALTTFKFGLQCRILVFYPEKVKWNMYFMWILRYSVTDVTKQHFFQGSNFAHIPLPKEKYELNLVLTQGNKQNWVMPIYKSKE